MTFLRVTYPLEGCASFILTIGHLLHSNAKNFAIPPAALFRQILYLSRGRKNCHSLKSGFGPTEYDILYRRDGKMTRWNANMRFKSQVPSSLEDIPIQGPVPGLFGCKASNKITVQRPGSQAV